MALNTLAHRLDGPNEADRRLRRGGSLRHDPRLEGRHDRDRQLYARSLLRLAGVTQVLSPTNEGSLTHNRLTHTFKVAQVARSLAEYLLVERAVDHDKIVALGGLDVDVVEAAALAHDMGHPPFGHIGEVVLDEYARKTLDLSDGYEGNAQAFRIITKLEPRSTEWNGMDLLPATRAAVLKYPWSRSQADETNHPPPKFGHYDSEQEDYRLSRAWLPGGYPEDAQSLEAALMDVADDITYALHDLEDFRGAGLISPIEVQEELNRWVRNHGESVRAGEHRSDEGERLGRLRARLSRDPKYSPDAFVDAVETVARHMATLSQANSAHWRVTMSSSRRLVSRLITEFIGGVEVNAEPTRLAPPVSLAADHWHTVQVLKQLTRDFVIARSDVAAVQRGQQYLLKDLLDRVRDWASHPSDLARVPAQLRELHSLGERGLIDYVASLTDGGAVALHRTLKGEGLQTIISGVSF